MNLRCFYCQTPFTLGRAEVMTALQNMYADNLNHYDAHCPRCRRANSVSRERLEMSFPNWRQVAAENPFNPMEPPPTLPAPLPQPELIKPAPVSAAATPVAKAEEKSVATKAPRKRSVAKKAPVKPVAKVAAKPIAKKPTAKPKAKPAAKTATKPVAKPKAKPVKKTAPAKAKKSK